MTDDMLKMIKALESTQGLVTYACEETGFTLKQHEEWMLDEDYIEKVRWIEEAKKDYIEGKLLEAVGDLNASVLTNLAKTILRSRGYSTDTTDAVDMSNITIGYGE